MYSIDEQRPVTGEPSKPEAKSSSQGKKAGSANAASIKKIKVMKQPHKKQASGTIAGADKPTETQPGAEEPEG